LLGGLALSQGGTAETGGAPIALLVAGSSLSSLQSLAGVRVDRRIPVGETSAIVPSVQVGWAYEMLDTAARATARLTDLPGSGFVVSNAPAGRSSLVMGTQATLETATPFQLFASYSVALNSNATAQNVTAGLRFIW
jgi:outer membrane autotransporter protein